MTLNGKRYDLVLSDLYPGSLFINMTEGQFKKSVSFDMKNFQMPATNKTQEICIYFWLEKQ